MLSYQKKSPKLFSWGGFFLDNWIKYKKTRILAARFTVFKLILLVNYTPAALLSSHKVHGMQHHALRNAPKSSQQLSKSCVHWLVYWKDPDDGWLLFAILLISYSTFILKKYYLKLINLGLATQPFPRDIAWKPKAFKSIPKMENTWHLWKPTKIFF
jgi:hypothetical protein